MADSDQSSGPDSVVAGPDLARQALAQARKEARTRAAEQAKNQRNQQRRLARAEQDAAREGGDPVAFGAAMKDLLTERGWERQAAVSGLESRWPVVVGPEIAARCRPIQLRAGELVIEAESTAWATQLRLLSRQLLTKLTAELGKDVVSRLVIRGPSAPDWRHGRLRVAGPGPRDTYG